MTTTSTHPQLENRRGSMAANQEQLGLALQKYLARFVRRSWRCRTFSEPLHPRLAAVPTDSEDLTDCSFERTVRPVSHETHD